MPEDAGQRLPAGEKDVTKGSSIDGSLNGVLPVIIPPEGINLKARLLQVEWEYVSAALRKAEGRRELAARMLGMTGHTFRKALKERLSAFADEGWEEGL